MATTISHLSPFSKFPTSASHSSLPSPVLPFQPARPRILKISCCISFKQSNDQISATQNDAVDKLRVVFAAGGTGGRIYPAVAIADELRITKPTCEILFIGTPNSMESTAIPSAGYNFTSVPPVRLARPLFFSLQNLFFPYHLIKSLIQCFGKLRDFEPHVVVGTGGYVSFPVCLAAKIKGIKMVIQEQNSVPGLANWALSSIADMVFVAFNSTIDSFPREKCVVCGNPVRLSLRNSVSKAMARSHFFPGSVKIRDSKAKMLKENSYLYIIWQTGVEAYDEMDSLVKDHPHLYLTPFMHSMDLAYAAADVIVSRAGAMTCYEILATGKPSILIPSPHIEEGHQLKNAALLADLAGVTVITEDELDSSTLASAIEQILRDERKSVDMSERALKAANPNASAEIVKHILSLSRYRRSNNKKASPIHFPGLEFCLERETLC
ncbi:hypothetical protein L6164_005364 [Bauhinia variegata]|uniref:Uncharacterized protein n=1 Tax=Bauhinia variegata TaxID=167791 RepID=A0ACB9PQY4_BAUVA|nr:hypothetical protein L6164_005364 [Bauhinia variegata]